MGRDLSYSIGKTIEEAESNETEGTMLYKYRNYLSKYEFVATYKISELEEHIRNDPDPDVTVILSIIYNEVRYNTGYVYITYW
jgi:hypothetical protein